MPKITGLDFGLSSLTTDDEGKKSGRIRYADRYRKTSLSITRATREKSVAATGGSRKRTSWAERILLSPTREAGIQEHTQLIARSNAIVCIGDLWLAFVLQNHNLSVSAYDACLGRATTVLRRECKKRGCLVIIQCRRFDASTKTCFECKAINPKITLNDRRWVCPGCGVFHDRDANAARNIRMTAFIRPLGKSHHGLRIIYIN